MPAVTSLADFNRNQSAVISRLSETAEPLYLTRNAKEHRRRDGRGSLRPRDVPQARGTRA